MTTTTTPPSAQELAEKLTELVQFERGVVALYYSIEALRVASELWTVVVDPRAQFFGVAVTQNEQHRYWFVLITGQKGQEMGGDMATAAR